MYRPTYTLVDYLLILAAMFSTSTVFSQTTYEYLPFREKLSPGLAGVIRSDSTVIIKPNFSTLNMLGSEYFYAQKFKYPIVDSCYIFKLDGSVLIKGDYERIELRPNSFLASRITDQGNAPPLVIRHLYNKEGKLLLSPENCSGFTDVPNTEYYLVVRGDTKKRISVQTHRDKDRLVSLLDFAYSLENHRHLYKAISKLNSKGILTQKNVKKIKPAVKDKNPTRLQGDFADEEFVDETIPPNYTPRSENVNPVSPDNLDSTFIINNGRHTSSFISVKNGETYINDNYYLGSQKIVLTKRARLENEAKTFLIRGKSKDNRTGVRLENFLVLILKDQRNKVLKANGDILEVPFDSIARQVFVELDSGAVFQVFLNKKVGLFCANGKMTAAPNYTSVGEKGFLLDRFSDKKNNSFAYIFSKNKEKTFGLMVGNNAVIEDEFDSIRNFGDGFFAENEQSYKCYFEGTVFQLKNKQLVPYGFRRWGDAKLLAVRHKDWSFHPGGYMNDSGWSYLFRP